jgi:dihydrofolate reductase
MGSVIVDISVSIDGFIAGRNISKELPMGEGGELLHDWFFKPVTERDKEIMAEVSESAGAVIIGRTMYDTAIEDAWANTNPFNAHVFVITSRAAPEKRVEGFTFITDGIHSALNHAQGLAAERVVWVVGGANIIQQYIRANLLNEIRLHYVPILLSEGTRLFEHSDAGHTKLEKQQVTESPAVIHVRYGIVKP